MVVQESLFDHIAAQIDLLSVEERLRLIQRLAGGIEASLQPAQSRKMQYGQFRGSRMSTEEDFQLAEWRPDENGE